MSVPSWKLHCRGEKKDNRKKREIILISGINVCYEEKENKVRV